MIVSYPIGQSVGLRPTAKNNPNDVRVIQKLLNGCRHLSDKLTQLTEDGIVGPKTEHAISLFQQIIVGMSHPDQIVEPNKLTHQKLMQSYKAEPSFVTLPHTINGVRLIYAETVNREVHANLLKALVFAIDKKALKAETLSELYVSSAHDSHALPSRHAIGKSLDISRVNGKRMGIYYPADPLVKAVVDGLQHRLELASGRRENFGPCFKKKLGQPFTVSGHNDHIHFSVD